ncbi:MAG: type II toxin-antitoxin system VapC family toxin [Hyphomonadaceae bacterium]
MRLYLDASVLVALFVNDPLSQRAHAAIAAADAGLIVSDFASLEFGASIQRFARGKLITGKDARSALQEFDRWTAVSCERAETMGSDIVDAAVLVRRDDLALRGSDAVHVAIVQRLAARLLTFDRKMASNAKRLGLAVA